MDSLPLQPRAMELAGSDQEESFTMTIQNLAERVALCFEISESDDGGKFFRPDPDCPRLFVDAIQSMICAVIYDPDAVYEMAHHVASHMSNFEEIDQARETLCNIVPDQGDELSEWRDADPDRAEDVEKIQSDLDCDLIEASFIAWQNEAEKLFDELADYLAVRGEEMEREEV